MTTSWWLNITEFYSLTILETGSQKSEIKVPAELVLPEAPRESPFQAFLLDSTVSGNPGLCCLTATCLRSLPQSSHCFFSMCPFPLLSA